MPKDAFTVKYEIIQKTKALWEADDPILRNGQVAYSTDTHEFRFGDDVHHYTELPSSQGNAGNPGPAGAPGSGPTTYWQTSEPLEPNDGDLWIDEDDYDVFHIPAGGGTTGQILKKTSGTDYDYAWYAFVDLPSGGAAGRFLKKLSNFDYDYAWSTLLTLPAGGSTGQALKKLSGTDGDAGWAGVSMYPFTRTWTVNQLDGVFSWLGTFGGKAPWRFPAKISPELADPINVGLVVTQSSNNHSASTADRGIDHNYNSSTGAAVTGDVASSWWKADFGAGHTITPTRVGIFGWNAGTHHPRYWKVQGSNDNSSWTDLLTVTNDGPSNSTWYSAAIAGSAAYRYLRILQTSTNTSGTNHLVLGEVEFWGTVT